MKMTFFFGAENPLSNWHPSPFVVKDVLFQNNEQFMMHCKAMLFKDHEAAEKIMKAKTPREQKALGRTVRNFVEDIWNAKCENYVFVGSLAKFRQNPQLGEFLLATGNSELVEASPYDRIWGVGLRDSDKRIHDKSSWQGQNKLGIIQMQVRDTLRLEMSNSEKQATHCPIPTDLSEPEIDPIDHPAPYQYPLPRR